MTRIDKKFAQLKAESKKAFVSYIMAGDPNLELSYELMERLPASGVDIIELGLPFTDPMADGSTIQLAGQRALKEGMTLQKTLDMAKKFRLVDDVTPIVLMGYYNPIYSYGVEKFLQNAKECGIDGLIVVDLPYPENKNFASKCKKKRINFIQLISPTTSKVRLKKIIKDSHDMIYYISMLSTTDLPVVVGFGIKTPENSREIASIADGAVVGSAIVEKFADGASVDEICEFVESLAIGAHAA